MTLRDPDKHIKQKQEHIYTCLNSRNIFGVSKADE